MQRKKDEKYNTIRDILSAEGLLKSMESLQPALLWMPESQGKYTIQIFVWKGKDDPSALSPPTSVVVEVL